MAYSPHFHTILVILFLGNLNAIRVLRNTISVSESEPQGGAKLTSVPEPVNTEDLTICLRVYLKVLGSWEYKAQIIQIEDWRTDHQNPVFRLLWMGAWYPATWFGFGSPQTHGSYASYLLKDPVQNTYKIWNPSKWSHICLSYRKSDSFLRVVKDGTTLNINFIDSRLSDVEIPPDFLNKLYLGGCAKNYTAGCSAPGAIFTDFNVWNRALTESAMQDWTACKEFTQGNIVSWDTSTWSLENMVDEEWSDEPQSLCKPAKMGYVLFPEKRNYSSANSFCHKMKGTMPAIKSLQINEELVNIISNHFEIADNFWAGLDDEEEDGIFKDINTGDILEPSNFQPWYPGEPNGGDIENCIIVWPTRGGSWNDYSCDNPLYTFCEFEYPPYLQIRGLCVDSIFDTQYSWTGHLMNGHHSFQGYTDSVLYNIPRLNLWKIESFTYPHISATLESEEYPLGTDLWTVHNDSCINASTVILNFNSCTDEEFNCIDGSCINISGRCDGRINCADKTDEIGCQMINIDQSYIKEVPAPPENTSLKLTGIDINVDVLSVLKINEVAGIFSVQFMLSLTWFDKRLILNNLKVQNHFNTVTKRDMDKIWIPQERNHLFPFANVYLISICIDTQVVFFNTENKEESLQDEKAYVTIAREGDYTVSPSSALETTHIFYGSKNPLTIKRVYSSNFLCEYDMGRYPFDQQTCAIIFILKGNTDSFAKLILGNLEYLGPIDLTQYYLKDWFMLEDKVTGNSTSVEIKMVLGRRILNEILTTYLPTILICLVSFSTNYFKPFFFEAIVTVNLTSLLVLTTLFISVSSNLPKTSYIKMIDIWLIFVLCVPFMEVVLHTIIDTLRMDDKDSNLKQLNSNTETKKGSGSDLHIGNRVVPLNSVSKPSLVSRNEKAEVNARRDYYKKSLKIARKNERVLYILKTVLEKGLPTIFALFSVGYFAAGINFSSQ